MVSGGVRGHHGMDPWSQRPDYQTYKSPYFSRPYKVPYNFHGIDAGRAMKFGVTAGSFGVVAGIFALYFFSDIPRVRKDIMTKLPFIGSSFIKEIPPSDNPF